MTEIFFFMSGSSLVGQTEIMLSLKGDGEEQ